LGRRRGPREGQREGRGKVGTRSSWSAAISTLPIDVSPPTDDRPFFFQMARLRNAFRPAAENVQRREINNTAVNFLSLSLAAVGGVTVLFISFLLLFCAPMVRFRNTVRPVVFYP